MKKNLVFFLIILLCASCFGLGRVKQTEVHEFDSIPMLEKFYKEGKASSSWDNIKISLITMSKDDPLYSWFGHTGLLVERSESYSIFYDYGRFAFSKDFYINFVKGQLWYGCGGYYSYYEFEEAIEHRRTISKVELDLTASQKKAIAEFLDINSEEPYDRYLYHHYNDNCATRIRDIINYATGGDFERWAKTQKGYSFRDQTSRILHNNMPIEWVLDLLQGPSIDGEATLWEEMFLPENLEKAVLEYGKITKEHTYIADFRDTETRPQNYEVPQSYVIQSLIAGCAIALIVLLSAKYCRPAYVIETSIINALLAIIGSLLFYMMFFSGHSFSWNNENILMFNPLLWIPFIFGFRFKNLKNKKIQLASYGAFTLVTVAVIAIKVFAPQLLEQANYPQLVAVLPYYLANFIVCLFEVI